MCQIERKGSADADTGRVDFVDCFAEIMQGLAQAVEPVLKSRADQRYLILTVARKGGRIDGEAALVKLSPDEHHLRGGAREPMHEQHPLAVGPLPMEAVVLHAPAISRFSFARKPSA